MHIFSLGVVWFVLLFCHNPCVMGGKFIPGFYPEDSLFDDCEFDDFKPFKNKCLMMVTDSSLDWDDKLGSCDGMPVYIESDEERQFYFDVLLGGRETYVLQLLQDIGGGLLPVFPGPDPSYIESQTIGNSGTYHPLNMTIECLIRKDDIKECLEWHMDNPNYDMAVACGIPRPLFEGVAHECDIKMNKKLRRDATRTIKMTNDKPDICYIRIKSHKDMKPSMIKVYSHSFHKTSSCIPGFFITSNTDLVVSDSSLPPLKCGEMGGTGRPLIKKKSGRGGEIRVYFVMNGDGTPLSMRAKGKAFVL